MRKKSSARARVLDALDHSPRQLRKRAYGRTKNFVYIRTEDERERVRERNIEISKNI